MLSGCAVTGSTVGLSLHHVPCASGWVWFLCEMLLVVVVHLTLSFDRAALGLQEMHSQGEARQSLSPLIQVSTAAIKCDSSLSVCALLWVLQDETINSSYKNKAWCIGKAGETERGVKRCYLDGWAGAHITQACQRCGQLAAPVLGERGATARTYDVWTGQKLHFPADVLGILEPTDVDCPISCPFGPI